MSQYKITVIWGNQIEWAYGQQTLGMSMWEWDIWKTIYYLYAVNT